MRAVGNRKRVWLTATATATGLALLLLANTPMATAVSIRILSAARESCTRARNVASAIQQAQRCVFDDNHDVLDHLNRPRRVRLTVNGPTGTSEFPDVGQSVSTSMIGTTEFFSHFQGRTTGSLAFGGTNISANHASLEMHDTLTTVFESDTANLIQLQLHFSGVTYHDTPYVLNLKRLVDGAEPVLISEASITPADGNLAAALAIPSAGLYEFSVEWIVPEFVLPAGDSSAGIGFYSIHWQMVPEPATAAMLTLGALLSGGLIPRRKSRSRAT